MFGLPGRFTGFEDRPMQYCSCFCAQLNDVSSSLGFHTCIGTSMLTLRWSSTMSLNAPFEAACL